LRAEERRLEIDVRGAFRSSLLVIGTMSKWLLAAGRALFLSARGWVLCALLVIAALVTYYVLSDRYTPFTTDAFVQAFVIQVTARVEGQVVRVDVQENQPVKKGDLLFEIDPRPFEHRVAVLEARLVDAVRQVEQMGSELAASKADDERIVAGEAYARAVQEQETEIRRQQATTERKYLDAVQKYRMARADRERSRALTKKVEQALAARVGGEHSLVAGIKAELADARLNPSDEVTSHARRREAARRRASGWRDRSLHTDLVREVPRGPLQGSRAAPALGSTDAAPDLRK
jgi:multidrug resistance efflux pump